MMKICSNVDLPGATNGLDMHESVARSRAVQALRECTERVSQI
jgi:hypothetical protein